MFSGFPFLMILLTKDMPLLMAMLIEDTGNDMDVFPSLSSKHDRFLHCHLYDLGSKKSSYVGSGGPRLSTQWGRFLCGGSKLIGPIVG